MIPASVFHGIIVASQSFHRYTIAQQNMNHLFSIVYIIAEIYKTGIGIDLG